MNVECYIKLSDRTCVEICGSLVCDELTVSDYGNLCERCKSGDGRACMTLFSRYGCDGVTPW